MGNEGEIFEQRNNVNTITETTNINELPDEMLSRILHLLPIDDRVRIERVCRHWRRINYSGKYSPWFGLRRLEVKDSGRYARLEKKIQKHELAENREKAPVFLALAKRIGSNLRELDLSSFYFDDSGSFLGELAPYTPNLQFLRVWLIDGTAIEQLHRLAEFASDLKGFSVRYDNDLPANALNEFLHSANKLETLVIMANSLNGNLAVLPSSLHHLQIECPKCIGTKQFLPCAIRNCPNLCTLHINGLLDEEMDEKFPMELAKLKNLKCLKIRDIFSPEANHLSYERQNRSVGAMILQIIAQCFPQLLILHIDMPPGFHSSQLWELTKLRRLRELSFNARRWARRWRDQQEDEEEMQVVQHVLATIAANTTSLEHLFVNFNAPADFFLNTVLRPAKSLRAFHYPYVMVEDCDVDEFANIEYHKFNKFIQALAVAEEESAPSLGTENSNFGNPERRKWPLYCFLRAHWNWYRHFGSEWPLHCLPHVLHWHGDFDYAKSIFVDEVMLSQELMAEVCPNFYKAFSKSETLTLLTDEQWLPTYINNLFVL